MAKSFKKVINGNNVDREKRIKNCSTQPRRQQRIDVDDVVINLRSVRNAQDLQEIMYGA